MSPNEERVWQALVRHREAMKPGALAKECGVSQRFVENLLSRISSPNWQENTSVRDRHVGNSNYSTKKIQPWDIWLEYKLNPWDADIVKRVLRTKPGQRRLDYEKIIHVCEERMRQLDEEERNAAVEEEKGDYPKTA